MTIAKAQAETSEQTGLKRRPGTGSGLEWGGRWRYRRRRIMRKCSYIQQKCSRIGEQGSFGPAPEDPEIAIAPPSR